MQKTEQVRPGIIPVRSAIKRAGTNVPAGTVARAWGSSRRAFADRMANRRLLIWRPLLVATNLNIWYKTIHSISSWRTETGKTSKFWLLLSKSPVKSIKSLINQDIFQRKELTFWLMAHPGCPVPSSSSQDTVAAWNSGRSGSSLSGPNVLAWILQQKFVCSNISIFENRIGTRQSSQRAEQPDQHQQTWPWIRSLSQK